VGQVTLRLTLFGKVLVGIVLLFGVVATVVSLIAAWELDRSLSDEFRSKGTAIAVSIASSSVELMLNRDGSTLQATIDQFVEIRGVAYVFVEDDEAEIYSHTFVPFIPALVRQATMPGSGPRIREDVAITDIDLPDGGRYTNVAAPILAGVAGTVHVGMDRAVIDADIRAAILKVLGLLAILMVVSVGVAYVLVNRTIGPVRVLTTHVRSLGGLDLMALEPDPEVTHLAATSTDEFGELARAFLDMEAELKQALKSRDELVGLRRELDIAGSIQGALLPHALPAAVTAGRFDVAAKMIPAREVGGDFYDYFLIDDDRLGFVVGDVSGKGVAAALYMAVSRTLLRATALRGLDPGECLRLVNDRLCGDTDSGLFVTISYGVLDTRTGEIAYATGGHPPPFLMTVTGAVRELPKVEGTVLGMLEDLDFGSGHDRLAPGERLVLYSDGVSEAENEAQVQYTPEGLGEFLTDLSAGSAEGVADAVVASVYEFAGTAPQGDDITVLALTFHGSPAGPA
jgi:serine phosphatase RsbU (regulator of sigma subunit)